MRLQRDFGEVKARFSVYRKHAGSKKVNSLGGTLSGR